MRRPVPAPTVVSEGGCPAQITADPKNEHVIDNTLNIKHESEVATLNIKLRTNTPSNDDPLAATASEHIREMLGHAVRLTEGDLPENLPRLRKLLDDISDQADAWVLARINDDEPGETLAETPATPPAQCSLLSRPGGDPVDEFLLIPFGEVRVDRAVSGTDFVFDRRHAESAKEWFEQMSRKLAIDYEHQSFERYNTRSDGLRPAAGWISRLDIREDGLWAGGVVWTERAKNLLRSGEYRYFSPVIYWTDEDYTDLAALGPVALTNDPAMRGVRPLIAARSNLDEASAPSGDQAVELREEIETLNGEIELLRRQLEAQEADAFIESGMRLGKIVDSASMDWRADYMRNPEGAAAKLERAPVILPPGRVMKLDARGEPARLSKTDAREAQRDPHGVDPEDLAAYDRAMAAGRILRLSAASTC